MPRRIFITGGSGCVGHYLAETLIEQTADELFFLLRQPEKLSVAVRRHPRVHVLVGSLPEIGPYEHLLPTMDAAILLATQWGGEGTFAVNVTGNLRILGALDPQRCQQVIYFSTASLLDRQLRLLPEAKTLGTEYIRSKYACYAALAELPIYPRLTVLFPTLIFGGEPGKPYSHTATALEQLPRWLRWLRWFQVEACFHFIHAQDIAQVVRYLLDHPPNGFRQLVLGNEMVWFNQALQELCDYFSIPLPPWRLNLTPARVELALKLAPWLGVQLLPWDRFCARYRYFCYEQVWNPARLGLPSRCRTLTELLAALGVQRPARRQLSQ